MNRENKFKLVLAALIVVGLVFGYPGAIPKLLNFLPIFTISETGVISNLVQIIGSSLVLVGLFGLTVDRFLKKKFIMDIASDVSVFMRAAHLPVGFQKELASLSQERIYRKDMVISYVIAHEENADTITLTTTITYSVCNATDDDYDYTHQLLSDRTLISGEDRRKITHAACEGVYEEAPETSAGTLGVHEGDALVFRKEKIKIPARGSRTFTATMEEAADLEDSDVMIFQDGAMNMSVQVRSPEHINATVEVAHRLRKDFKPFGERNNRTWKFSSEEICMLPFQSTILQWKKNDE